jgi:membrane fusion protein
MTTLFRRAAMSAPRRRLLGDVVIARPPALTVLAAFVVSAVVAGAVFVSRASYARKETVVGYLSPDRGIVRVHPPRSGIVGRLFVREGELVAAGAPLVILLGDRTTGDGVDVDALLLASLDAQLAEIESRRSLEFRRRETELQQFTAEIGSLEAERAAIGRRLSIQADLVRNLESNLDRLREVASKGYLSTDEFRLRENRLLENRRLLASLEQERAGIVQRQLRSRSALSQAPLQSEDRLSALNSLYADLVQKKTELKARESIVMTAPVAGRITALRAFAGESVAGDLPLLTILPAESKLEAQLFVPTRAIGFVRVGQDVRLLLDAFDYRRFGPHDGVITAVSSSVFLPAETRLGRRINEPTYRVTVDIEDQSVRAYGQEFFLQAGMSLRADIILEERTLLDWLLDPIVSLRGRQ